MTEFENTDSSFIKRKAKEIQQNPKVGQVTEVIEHRNPTDNSNFELNISTDDDLFTERSVEYTPTGSDQIAVPTVGDSVLLNYEESEGNHPVATKVVSNRKKRPPLGRAGMTRDKFSGPGSPVGTGNIYATGYTQHSSNPAKSDTNTPEKAWYQIAKHSPTPDPIMASDADMLIGMHEDKNADTAEIRLMGSQIDGVETQGVEVLLDFKSGDIHLKAENSTGEFGIKFNTKNGTFKVMDQEGYGIESDGAGNFTWHYESIDHKKGSTMNF